MAPTPTLILDHFCLGRGWGMVWGARAAPHPFEPLDLVAFEPSSRPDSRLSPRRGKGRAKITRRRILVRPICWDLFPAREQGALDCGQGYRPEVSGVEGHAPVVP